MPLEVKENLSTEELLSTSKETLISNRIGDIAKLNQGLNPALPDVEKISNQIKQEAKPLGEDTLPEALEQETLASDAVADKPNSAPSDDSNSDTPTETSPGDSDSNSGNPLADLLVPSSEELITSPNEGTFNLAYNTLSVSLSPSSMLTYNDTAPSYMLSYNSTASVMYSLNEPLYSSLGSQGAGLILSDSGVYRTPLTISATSYHPYYLQGFAARPITPSGLGIVGVSPAESFFVKAASAISGILNVESKPKASTLGPATNFKVADTSGFFTTTLVQQIPHVEVNNNHTSVVGIRAAFQDANNHYFFIQPTGLQTTNSSGLMATINLVSSSTILDTLYMLRRAGTGTPQALNTTNTRAGSLIFNPIAATLAQQAPDKVDLVFSQNNIYNVTDLRHGYVFAASNVPGYIATTVTGPANALVLYNLLQGIIPATGPGVFPISNYSPTSVITSLHNGKDIGALGSSLVIDASNNITTIIYKLDTTALTTKNLFWVDTNLVIKGQGTFAAVPNPGAVIDKGEFSYVNVADTNRDGVTDLLFGSKDMDNGILVYGATAGFPTLIHLDSPPSSAKTTEFVMPDSNIVGVPIAPDAIPADGGAALNALSTKTAGVNFVGDVNGDGFVDLVVEKHSADYSYDSDLAYIVYGQESYFPHTIELLPYGNSQLNEGTVGIGKDINGNVVQNVNGFYVTGPTITTAGEVGPSNFSLKSVGDLNADGFDDLIAFANNNAAYALFGHPTIGEMSSNINLAVITPYMLPLFFLPSVANSTDVPTINDINAGNLNGDAFNDLIFSSAISLTDLQDQTIAFSKYLTAVNNGSGTTGLGSILSGAVFTDGYFTTLNNVSGVIGIPVGSAYIFKTAAGTFDTSHVILGLNNQSTIEGFTGIDNLIGGAGNQHLIEHGLGATNPNLPGVVGSTLIGGNGNSIFELADPAFHMVKGGAGFDILRLNSGTLDLTKAPDPTATSLVDRASHIVEGIEKFELANDTNVVLDPASLLDINDYGFNQSVTPIVGLLLPGGTNARSALLISSQNGVNQDPAHAPHVDLYTDPTHQWIASVGPSNINGVLTTEYILTGNPTPSQQQTSVLIEQSIQVNIHSA